MKYPSGTEDCRTCSGTGKIPDDRDWGAEARARRERVSLSLREVARRLELSAPYISDLELGRRSWTRDLWARFVGALR